MSLTSRLALIAVPFALLACEDHFSTQDAYAVCDTLTTRNPAINPPADFLDCVACYESCGSDCAQTSNVPATYVCPGEVALGGGGSGGSGADSGGGGGSGN